MTARCETATDLNRRIAMGAIEHGSSITGGETRDKRSYLKRSCPNEFWQHGKVYFWIQMMPLLMLSLLQSLKDQLETKVSA